MANKTASKKPLFNESTDDEDEGINKLTTNESYAKNYNEFRKKELLQKLKDRGQDVDEDSSSDDIDTDEEVINPEFDKEVFKAISFLVSKDPEKYKQKPEFFSSVKPVEELLREKRERKEKSKPMTITDYKREILLKHGSEFIEEDVDERPPSPTYVEEQERLKAEFKKAMEDDSDDELLVKREKTREEEEHEEEEYLKWLAGQKEDAPEDVKELKPLKEFWSSDKLSKEDRFLRDYILNKRYLDNGDVPTYEEIVDDVDEDEKELEKEEEFEHKFNFRFEEPDQEYLKRYPRVIPDSVRMVDSKRKEKRKERQERKELEKQQKRKEIDELNKLKREELEEKLQRLKDVAQNEKFNLRVEDLEADFDPDEYDRLMKEKFDDEFYNVVEEGDQKPEYPDLDKELGIENPEDYDNYQGDEDEAVEGHCEDDDFIMDADYDPVAARKEKEAQLREELIDSQRSRKRKKRMSKVGAAIKQKKPVFDPDEKTYEEYLDEYYKLDYEDVIGDTQCRFKYVETVPNDFGLTIEEILMASNKELNQWASLKKTMQNRPKNEELSDKNKYKKRGQNIELKKKIFKSLYGPQEDEQLDENIKQAVEPEPQVEPPTVEKKRKRKKKQKKAETESTAPSEPSKIPEAATNSKKEKKMDEATSSTTNPEEKIQTPKKKKNQTPKNPEEKISKNKTPQNGKKAQNFKKGQNLAKSNKGQGGKDKLKANLKKSFKSKPEPKKEMSDARLRAFGINPKKHYNKLKYGQQKNRKQ